MGNSGQIDLASASPFRVGLLTAEPALRQVSTTSTSTETLQPRVMQVLVALARANGAIVSRDALVQQCWEGRIVGDDSINRVISRLRRLSEERAGGSFRIETITKVGYRLIGEVALVPSAEPPPLASDFARSSVPAPRRWVMAVVAALAAVVAFAIWQYRLSVPAPAPGVEISLLKATAEVPGSLASAVQNRTLSELSYGASVPASLPGGAVRQPYILTGAIRREADKLNATFNLTSRRTGDLVWSTTTELPADDPTIAETWGYDLATALICGMRGMATKPDLSEKVLALHFQVCSPPPGTRNEGRVDLARRVTVADADFALGWAELGQWSGQSLYDGTAADPTATRKEGMDAARRAQKLDPGLAEGWAVVSALVPLGNYAERERYLRRALKERPLDCGCISQWLADTFVAAGRLRDAEAFYRRALDHLPSERHPRFMLARMQLARDPESPEALAWLADPKLGSKWASAIAYLRIESDLNRGRYAEAKDRLAELERSAAGEDTSRARAAVEALASGDPAAKARAAALLRQGITDPDKIAKLGVQLLGALGDDRGALALAEAMSAKVHDRGPGVLFTRLADGARRLPEFTAFAQRSGLLPYWRKQHITPDFCKEPSPAPICAQL